MTATTPKTQVGSAFWESGPKLNLTRSPAGNTVLPAVTTLTFKVSEEEARRIRSQARKEGVTVSEFLRRRATAVITKPRKPRRVRCKHTGAMIFSPPSNEMPLTTEIVREMLSDFP